MFKLHRFFFLVFLILFLNVISCSTKNTKTNLPVPIKDVILFYPNEYGNRNDLWAYKKIATELGYSTYDVDYQFINERDSFFDKNDHRKVKVLILPGGHPYSWFEQISGRGINCKGVKNILDFVESGGSVIAICICGSSLFSSHHEWLNPTLKQAQQGKWTETKSMRGAFYNLCGVYAFKGALKGPQESNRPYPITRYLPIEMNLKNEIVRENNLPPVIYQIVVGGGSIIPDEGQSLDVVGWFPNGTAAIGIVPYGDGHIIMSNPHPNITGRVADRWRKHVMGDYAREWGWTEQMIVQGREIIKTDKDIDGSVPDWNLAKAMLSYAYKKASK